MACTNAASILNPESWLGLQEGGSCRRFVFFLDVAAKWQDGKGKSKVLAGGEKGAGKSCLQSLS